MNEAAPAEKPAIMPGAMQARTVLDIDNLQTHFFTAAGVVRQTDFGMKPYSALFGALKVADEVRISLAAAWPA